MEKQCFKCKVIKPLTEFYKHSKMKDGTVNKCKDCNKNDVKGNYLEYIKDANFIEKEKARARKKYHRLYAGTGRANSKQQLNYGIKYPEKIYAKNHSATVKKIFDGAEKHHWSYNKEHCKDVIQLIKKHHMKAHRFIVYDQERFMYRRFDTNELLDTKEKHIQFILWCIANKED